MSRLSHWDRHTAGQPATALPWGSRWSCLCGPPGEERSADSPAEPEHFLKYWELRLDLKTHKHTIKDYKSTKRPLCDPCLLTNYYWLLLHVVNMLFSTYSINVCTDVWSCRCSWRWRHRIRCCSPAAAAPPAEPSPPGGAPVIVITCYFLTRELWRTPMGQTLKINWADSFKVVI